MAAISLVCGLGNPGAQYEATRHNAGFWFLDALSRSRPLPWRPETRFFGDLADTRMGQQRVRFLKPATFMNESGRAVGEALRFYKLGTEALTVFHDELDLAPFKIKVKQGGGHAGHNGLRSIDQHCGPEFRRVRIGIGHPGHKDRVTGHVLGDYAKAERDDLIAMLGAMGAEAEWLAKGDDVRFMNDVALRMQEI